MSCEDEDSSDLANIIIKDTRVKSASTVTLSDVTAEWDKTPVDVKDCSSSWLLPQVVRLYEGDDADDVPLSAPSGTAPRNGDQRKTKSCHQPLLLYTARRCSKVNATNIEWNSEKREYEDVGPPVVIPVNYQGWFIFLTDQEENYETIEEVACASTSITSFLSRSSVTAFYLAQTSQLGKRLFLKKELPAGEVYSIREVVTEKISSPTRSCCLSWIFKREKVKDDFEELRFLRCTNSCGVEVMLPYEQKGVFTPIGSDEIMEKNAAYQLPDIVRLAELPIKVKLAFGQPPEVPCSFSGCMRFDEFFYEETIVACTMSCDQNVMVEFPLESEVQFLRATHQTDYMETAEYKQSMDYCEKNVRNYVASMKVLQNFDFKDSTQQLEKEDTPSPTPSIYQHARSLPPLPTAGKKEQIHQSPQKIKTDYVRRRKDTPTQASVSEGTDPDYESILHDSPSRHLSRQHSKFDDHGYMVPRTVKESETSQAQPLSPASNKRDSYCQTIDREEMQSVIRIRRSHRSNGTRNVDSGIQLDLASDAGVNTNTTTDELLEHLTETPANERINEFLTSSVDNIERKKTCVKSDVSVSDHDNVFYSPATTEEMDVFLEKLFDTNSMADENYSVDIPLSAAALARRRSISRHSDLDPAWTGSIRYRTQRNKARWMLNNANATLRKHNIKSVRPMMQFSMYDDPNKEFENIFDTEEERIKLHTSTVGRPRYRRSRSDYGTCRRVTSPDFCSTPKSEWSTVSGPKSWSEYKHEWDSIYQTMSQENWCPPEDLSEQTVNEVAMSLRFIGLKEDVVEHFIDEQIDGKQLLELNHDLLKEGFPESNALERKKIIDFIGGWRPKQ